MSDLTTEEYLGVACAYLRGLNSPCRTPEEGARAAASLEAMIARDADVRTLDEHVTAKGDRCGETWQCEQFSELPDQRWKVYVTGNGGHIFYGATPRGPRQGGRLGARNHEQGGMTMNDELHDVLDNAGNPQWPISAAVHAAACDQLGRLEAAEQALADVRTLDDWAAAGERWRDESPSAVTLYGPDSGTDGLSFFGAPDEARAKAAAWVREQGEL